MNDINNRRSRILGFVLTVMIGFAIYFILMNVPKNSIMTYDELIEGIHLPKNQFIWFLMNFTEGDFYAGPITAVFLFIGAFVAYKFAINGSKYRGIAICYGDSYMWPWVLASQILALLFTFYLFGYLKLFGKGNTWIPTFLVITSVPPSMMLFYGPGLKNLFTAALTGALICTPTAYYLSNVGQFLEVPGATFNVLAMGITGIVAGTLFKVFPWIGKPRVVEKTVSNNIDYNSPLWVLQRTLADISEPQFYGNELVSIFMLIGVTIEWILNPNILTGGAMALPAIILSQFISGALGVALYTHKFIERGWYATYVPVVCTAPACVLMFGSSMKVIVLASVFGGIIGAPIAEFLDDFRPSSYIHGTVNNVLAMAISTSIVASILKCML